MSEHEFSIDLTAHELERRAHVLTATGHDWDPVAVLEAEAEAEAERMPGCIPASIPSSGRSTRSWCERCPPGAGNGT